ncbi:PPM-type phosphatase domain-containing protein [Psidium guajava]|nr:PPM-type phosphatase domain-containing protein [Psidium guajava]
MQQHGFARNMDWSVAESQSEDGNPIVTLELKDGPYSRFTWDFSFQALYKERHIPQAKDSELSVMLPLLT